LSSWLVSGETAKPQKSMQRPPFSQSPKRVGSGPSRPPISLGLDGSFVAGLRSLPPTSLRASAAGFVLAAEPDDDDADAAGNGDSHTVDNLVGMGLRDMPVVCQKASARGTPHDFVCDEV
jgi:hypothetical protein